ncbi:MAG: hypothetical protein J2P46_21030, partial [Zavarzinella sp.]|nr:hypothetical protein [Zavarzinella sp.]
RKLEVEERVSLLELIQKEIGIHEGLNDRGSAVFIVLDDPKDRKKDGKKEPDAPWDGPPCLLAVAVTDYAKVARQLGVDSPKDGINDGQAGVGSGLLAAIGGAGPDGKSPKSPVIFSKRGDFVLLARPRDRDALDKVLKSKQSIAPALQPAREWLDQQDISGVCTQRGLHKAGLFMMGAGVESGTPEQVGGLKDTFAEVEKNVKLIAFAGNIDHAGHPRLLARVYFDPDGAYAKWIAQVQPADGSMLARLPDRPFLLAGLARVSAQASYEGLIRLMMSDLPAESRDKLTAKADQLVRRVSEVGFAIYMDQPGKKEPTVDGGLVARVDDAPAFVAGTVEVLKQVHEATKDKAEVKFEQKTLAGRPSWVIGYVPKSEPKDGIALAGGIAPATDRAGVVVLTELDRQTVLVSTPEKADPEVVVKRFADIPKQPLAKNAALQKAAATLPEKLQLAAYLNVQLIVPFFGLALDEPAPVAFALRALPAGLEAQFVVPFETLQAVVKADKAQKKSQPKEK